jgi:phosphoribosylamine--glycine ligase
MKVLVIGNGAREHSLCWRLKRSKGVSQVICAPGNPGISAVAECADIAVTDTAGLLNLAREKGVALHRLE